MYTPSCKGFSKILDQFYSKIKSHHNIEVLEVLSKEENNNRLIKVEDYGLLLIDKKTELSINIIKISRSLLFFKILFIFIARLK